MVAKQAALPKRAWLAIGIRTLVISLTMTLVYLGVTLIVMALAVGEYPQPLVWTALLVPPVVAAPVAGFLLVRQRRLSQHNHTLYELAFQDSMLGCMNRRGFITAVDAALRFAAPHYPCTLLAIDADNFKTVNDRFGHLEGDRALELITSAIHTSIRASDLFGRIGGEEFGVFLPGANPDHAKRIAGRIREEIALIVFEPEGKRHQLSVSIGGVVAYEQASFSQLYKSADKHLYAAKHQGRNKVSFSDGHGEAAA